VLVAVRYTGRPLTQLVTYQNLVDCLRLCNCCTRRCR